MPRKKEENLFIIIMVIYIMYYVIQYKSFLYFSICSVKKQHTMMCKACNSHVHNTNDMTLVHLNECFKGKFNDDHCRVQNYLYCFSCKTITPVHNNNNSCKAITPVLNNHKKQKFDM